MTKTIIKEKTIEECLKSLSQEKINEMYEEIPEEILKEVKTKKKKTVQAKIEILTAEILANYMVYTLIFTDEENNQLDSLIKGKTPNEISPRLLDNNFVFNFDNNYIVPTEIIDMYNYSQEKKLDNQRIDIVINFYLSANGVLEITKLIELVKATGLNTTKKEITELAIKNDYIINDNLIYIDKIAQEIDKNYNMHEQKKENTYKEFTMAEIFAIQVQQSIENYEEHIRKILSKKVKDKKQVSKCTDIICYMSKVGYNYIENIEDVLRTNEISLTEQAKEEIIDLANEINYYFPVWELNGHSTLELSADNEVYEESFEDLSEEEQLQAYIHTYLMLNAVIEIDKLLEILNDSHELNITKKDLIKQVSNIEDLIIYNKYICIEGAEDLIDEMIPVKNMLKEYKIIGDIDEIMDQLWYVKDRIIDLSIQYNLDEDVADGLEQIMHMAGGVTEEMLEEILKDEGYKLSSKKIKEIAKELSIIQKDVRIWSYNGFKKSELTNINKKDKIGRNDLCPCGSGKKYKKCCGK